MNGRRLLESGIQVIEVLSLAFGGFLLEIAPPEDTDARLAVGFASFLSLIVLFLVAALARRRVRRFRWMATVAACVLTVGASIAAARYYHAVLQSTYLHPPAGESRRYVHGDTFTEQGEAVAAKLRQDLGYVANAATLVAETGGPSNAPAIWTETSIEQARARLVGLYVTTFVLLSAALFSLTEGALATQRAARTADA